MVAMPSGWQWWRSDSMRLTCWYSCSCVLENLYLLFSREHHYSDVLRPCQLAAERSGIHSQHILVIYQTMLEIGTQSVMNINSNVLVDICVSS